MIVSEHDDRTACCAAARELRALLAKDSKMPLAQRDEVFVRKPNYKSLKAAGRRVKADK